MSKRDKENEEPTNDSRADRAMQLLWMYADGTGQRVAGQYTDELATIVQDALSDLMHYCDREELEYFDIQTKAFRRYREELKILPRHSRNPKTTTEAEQLPTSGRQGTTATPPNPATAYMLKHERQLLDTPAAQRLPILYADLFENLLSDSDNPTCQGLWKELQRRGWDIEQTLPGTLSKSWSLNAPEARKLGLSCADGNRITVTAWSEQPLPEITDQIISDRTAQHYTDPARD